MRNQERMATAPEIDAAIDNAYRVFARYRLRGRIMVLSSVSPEHEQALVKTPLCDLPREPLRAYTDSAHDWNTKVEEDLKYLLPRYFELIALGCFPRDLELALRRLSHANYRDTWRDEEAKAVDDAFVALMRLTLEQPLGDVRALLYHSAEDLLCMVAYARGDVGMLLSAWDDDRSRSATLHLAHTVSEANLPEGRLGNGMWYGLEGRVVAEAERVLHWIGREESRERLERACLAEADDEMAGLLSLAEAIVADHLSRG